MTEHTYITCPEDERPGVLSPCGHFKAINPGAELGVQLIGSCGECGAQIKFAEGRWHDV